MRDLWNTVHDKMLLIEAKSLSSKPTLICLSLEDWYYATQFAHIGTGLDYNPSEGWSFLGVTVEYRTYLREGEIDVR